MNILLITEFFPTKNCHFTGGVETRTFFTAKYLAVKNKVIVIARKKLNEPEFQKNGNLHIYRLGPETKQAEASFVSIFPRIYFVIQSCFLGLRKNIDIVEGSNFICLLPTFLIGLGKKIPKIAWYPDLYGSEWVKNFGLLTGIFGWLLEKTGLLLPWDHVIALSKVTKQKLIKRGIKENKITVVYAGIDFNFINKIKSIKSENPKICCIARLVPYKNIDLLIQAVFMLKKKISQVECLIIGNGPQEKNLQRLSRNLQMEKNIFFQKNLSYTDVIKNLKSSWLLCLPSKIEGFGLVTIEAVAAGLPFLIADIAINKEITQNLGGLYFKNGDKEDLAKELERLLKDGNLREDLIKKGKNLLNFYSWEKAGRETLEVYKKIINSISF